MTARPWTTVPGGLLLSLRVTPKGGRDAVEGIAQLADGRSVLKVRVRAPAIEGEANAALARFLSALLGVPGRDVSLVAGASSRVKRLRIAGNAASLSAALEKAVQMDRFAKDRT